MSNRQYFLRLPLKDQIIFIKRLAILIKAGTPLLSGLQMLLKQSKSRTLTRILKQVIRDVENGQYLATALGKFRKIFGEFSINLIEVGEISGTLSENLEYLALELKKKQALRRKVLSSMIYPIFIILATFGITVLLTVFVFPKIVPIFQSVDFNLPWSTRFLIFISQLLLNHGLVIFSGLVVLIILVWLLLCVKPVKYWYDRIILVLPVIGNLSQGYNMANVSRTFGLLLKSNVRIVRAVKITANVTGNLVYKKKLEALMEIVSRGEPISTLFEKNPKLFPAIMTQMVSIGENTGNLSETFLYLANMYEEEVDDITKNLSTVLEPLLLIFMGLLVGFVAISIITPIYGITQHLTP